MPQGFAGTTGANLSARALLGKPKEARDNSTAFSYVQFEGGGMLRLPDDRTSFGARVNIATSATGVSQPADRLGVFRGTTAGEFELQGAHDIPLHPNVGLTAALTAGLVFSDLRIEAASGFITGVNTLILSPHVNGGLGVYGSFNGFRPYAAVTLGTQVLSSANAVFTCQGLICNDSGAVRIGALVMATVGARYSWGLGAVEAGVVFPLTQVTQRLPVMLAFTAYFGDFAIKPRAKREPEPLPPPATTPPPPPPADVTQLPAETPPI